MIRKEHQDAALEIALKERTYEGSARQLEKNGMRREDGSFYTGHDVSKFMLSLGHRRRHSKVSRGLIPPMQAVAPEVVRATAEALAACPPDPIVVAPAEPAAVPTRAQQKLADITQVLGFAISAKARIDCIKQICQEEDA